MWPILLHIWRLKVTWLGLAVVIVAVGAAFGLWKKMRGEYKEDDIVSVSVLLTAAVTLGYIISREWGGILLGVWALRWWCKKKDWDFWEWGDFLGGVSLITGAIVSAAYGPARLTWAVGLGLGAVTTWILSRTYRKIKWYKSGKLGFLALVALMWWGVMEIIAAGLLMDKIIGVWVLTVSAIVLYLRAGRRTLEDLATIWPKRIRKS